MDVSLLALLILLNGLFAMSEMALTASRKARLQVMVESGEGGAQAAMDLHDNPTKFLSTVQIGITGIGVLNGIVGDAAFSGPLSHWLAETFELHPEATQITATALVVVMLIVTGALPPRLGFDRADTIAIQFCGSKKSLAAGLPMATVLFTGSTVGLIVLPLMIFHQIQLILCSMLASRYAKRPDPEVSE